MVEIDPCDYCKAPWCTQCPYKEEENEGND